MEESSVARAYACHHAYVLRTCAAILHNDHDAEDAAQEVFGRLLRQPAGQVRDERRWLGEVARNHCLDRLRKSGRRPTLPLGDAHSTPEEKAPEAVAVTRRHLATVLDKLDRRQRSALVRSAVLDQPLERIAADMGISYGAAGQLLWRARLQAVRIAEALTGVLAGLGGRRLLEAMRAHQRPHPRRTVALLRRAMEPEQLALGLTAIVVVALMGSSGTAPSESHAPAPGIGIAPPPRADVSRAGATIATTPPAPQRMAVSAPRRAVAPTTATPSVAPPPTGGKLQVHTNAPATIQSGSLAVTLSLPSLTLPPPPL
jgi:RNA polymerase sigma factor (sigma-70 family)